MSKHLHSIKFYYKYVVSKDLYGLIACATCLNYWLSAGDQYENLVIKETYTT